MTDAEFHHAIRRIWRLHWLHYGGQALLTVGVVLALSSQVGLGTPHASATASGPALLLLGALVPVVGLLLYLLARRLRPNLRRRAEENMRLYQARIFLRNSLLGLLGLPFLVAYALSRGALELPAYGFLLLVLAFLTAPSAKAYQRWLLS
ncbi:hypothetical protein [Hymenobacter glacieicola]|uniref:MFS transporter n=1 Tax=Hymenobacter glacieicola TaxID=1562124 RepID=A0ABQ1WWC9_9BACT|nr:hypothetical protein [Hymenobacter glacieicola]GGG47773.1 hypothetical protein GCM10011378_24970 [Hymenobacter glacieicola]